MTCPYAIFRSTPSGPYRAPVMYVRRAVRIQLILVVRCFDA